MLCPNCGAEIGESQRFCRLCGAMVASTAAEPQPNRQEITVRQSDSVEERRSVPERVSQYPPLCKTCERGALLPKKIFRMSGPVVVIGFILLIPSFLGIVVSAASLVVMIFSEPLGIALDPGVKAIVGTIAIFVGISSFVGGLLGWLLVMKKRVLQCAVCGATVTAS